MSFLNSPHFLRRVLLADAAISGATGALLSLAAELIAARTGLPIPLLRYAGLSLLPFAAIVGAVATRATIPAPAVWAIIIYNALWTIDSLVLLVSGLVAPNMLGYAFVIAQALAVGVLAELQYFGLRRQARRAA
jgi:hypothetical protein